MTRLALVALSLLVLVGRPSSAAAPPPIVSLAVADFVVTGTGEPRYWLGYLYAEVLARRLMTVNDLLVVEPLAVRQLPAGAAAQDVTAVGARCLELARALGVGYVVGGLIEDRGEQLSISCLVAHGESQRTMVLAQDVAFAELWQPQTEVVGRRFLPNLGLRVTPAMLAAMAAYDPRLTPETMPLVGQGWRAYAPDEPEDAFRTWRQALQLDPGCRLAGEAMAAVGIRYRRLLLDRSLTFYEQQVAAEPKNALARYHLGEIYGDLGRWADAEQQYTLAMELRTTFLDAYLGLIQALLAQSLTERAVLACDGALRLSPNNVKIIHNKAVALYRRGLVAEARALWQKILELDPADTLAKERLQQYGAGIEPRAGTL